VGCVFGLCVGFDMWFWCRGCMWYVIWRCGWVFACGLFMCSVQLPLFFCFAGCSFSVWNLSFGRVALGLVVVLVWLTSCGLRV